MNLYDYGLPYHYGNPAFGGHKAKDKTVHHWRMKRRGILKIPVPDYRGYLFGAERQVGYAGHAVIKYLVANFQLQRHRTVVRGECKGPLE